MKLFNYDSPFWSFMSRLADLIILNLLWIVFCIPVVTIGASTTAMYRVTLNMVRGEGSGVVRMFWDAFRLNLKQAVLIFLILLIPVLLVVYEFWMYLSGAVGQSMWLGLVFCCPSLILALVLAYVLIHGTIGQCVVDDGVDSRKEVAALLQSDRGTLRIIRNIPCDFKLWIVLDVLLCDGGLDEATLELTRNEFRNDIGYLCETDDVCVRCVLLREIHLDGTVLCTYRKLIKCSIVLILIMICLADDEGLTTLVVKVREVEGVCTLRAWGETSHAEVDIAALKLHEDTVEIHRYELNLEAEILSDSLCECDIEAGKLWCAICIDVVELIWCEVRRGRNGQLASVYGREILRNLDDLSASLCSALGRCLRSGSGGVLCCGGRFSGSSGGSSLSRSGCRRRWCAG